MDPYCDTTTGFNQSLNFNSVSNLSMWLFSAGWRYCCQSESLLLLFYLTLPGRRRAASTHTHTHAHETLDFLIWLIRENQDYRKKQKKNKTGAEEENPPWCSQGSQKAFGACLATTKMIKSFKSMTFAVLRVQFNKMLLLKYPVFNGIHQHNAFLHTWLQSAGHKRRRKPCVAKCRRFHGA